MRLPIPIMFYHGNLKDNLLKVLNHLQHRTPELNYYDDLNVRAKFIGSCLKQPKFTYTQKTIVNFYILY